jgi:RNA polymerase sigma-70 factor (ECF subfamily)
MANHDVPPELVGNVRRSVQQFRRAFESLRPELYRYCRHLTRSPWDAEDLVQDALTKAFVVLGSQYGHSIENPRTWLFRVATNLWIDRMRRTREVLGLGDDDVSTPAPELRATREAAGTLIAKLSPQERVAVVLKDAFELSLDEIAALLATSLGAVKAALHRGRGKLASDDVVPERVPTPAAIDRFCAAFNAGDLDALTALLLDTAIVELPGLAVDLGVEATRNPTSGILYHMLLSPLTAGVDARFLTDYLPTPPRAEVRLHRGEHLLLVWYAHRDGEAVRSFVRFEVDSEAKRVTSVRAYYFAREALAEVGAELGVSVKGNGYGTEYELEAS